MAHPQNWLWGQGWYTARNKVNQEEEEKIEQKVCDLCGMALPEDYCYVGFTHPKVIAVCCDSPKCLKWLISYARAKRK
jgi:hypothetical protein